MKTVLTLLITSFLLLLSPMVASAYKLTPADQLEAQVIARSIYFPLMPQPGMVTPGFWPEVIQSVETDIAYLFPYAVGMFGSDECYEGAEVVDDYSCYTDQDFLSHEKIYVITDYNRLDSIYILVHEYGHFLLSWNGVSVMDQHYLMNAYRTDEQIADLLGVKGWKSRREREEAHEDYD